MAVGIQGDGGKGHDEGLFVLACPVFSMEFKTYHQQALEQLDRWLEALKEAQFFTFCGLPHVSL